jgi:hypothetical protein
MTFGLLQTRNDFAISLQFFQVAEFKPEKSLKRQAGKAVFRYPFNIWDLLNLDFPGIAAVRCAKMQ